MADRKMEGAAEALKELKEPLEKAVDVFQNLFTTQKGKKLTSTGAKRHLTQSGYNPK